MRSRPSSELTFFRSALALALATTVARQALAQSPPAAPPAPPAAPAPAPPAAAPTPPPAPPSAQGAPPAAPPGWAPPPWAWAPPPAGEVPSGQQENGFVVSASFGTRIGLVPVLTETNLGATQGIAGNLALGFKADRVVGLLTLTFVDVATSGSGGTNTAQFALGPEFLFAIVRSEDRKVELLGDVGLGLGHLFGSSSNGGLGSSSFPSNLVIDYQLAIGARYWFHRQFSIQGLTGFAGEAFVDLDSSSGNLSAHGVFASLGILSVF